MFDLKSHLEALQAKQFADLADGGHGDWVNVLRKSQLERLIESNNGHLPTWLSAIERLPNISATRINFAGSAVEIGGECSDEERAIIHEKLTAFHPWRKGPFDLFGVFVDAEWRSDLKWQRIAPHIDLTDNTVLDVGCGNGYYGWRMLGAGARAVLGLEPFPLYNMQHVVFSRYANATCNVVIPGTDSVLDRELTYFDAAFSMGVFYHCKNPIGHLESLRRSLRSGGTLVLETLVVNGEVDTVLVPPDRYAKMRNVWMIPSTLMLERLLSRLGFREVRVVDVSTTTASEQRRTEWMTFESLNDFLDPNDHTLTAEGHPAPMRALVIAEKP